MVEEAVPHQLLQHQLLFWVEKVELVLAVEEVELLRIIADMELEAREAQV